VIVVPPAERLRVSRPEKQAADTGHFFHGAPWQ
jgi:hypothetical protein